MLTTLNKLNHHSLKFNVEIADAIEDICKPLFSSFGITNFGYVRIFNDGTMFRVSTDSAWNKKYFEHQFYNDSDFYNFDNVTYDSHTVKIFTNKPLGNVCSALYEHNIWNIFTLFERDNEGGKVWFFATTRENPNMINFYINNKIILEKFIEYFKQRASAILTIPDPSILITTELKLQNYISKEEQTINQFLEEINWNKKEKKLSLSSREKQCIHHLISGSTIKETARFLKISPRTAESYINNIKRKTKCKRRSQLLKIIFDEKIGL